MIEQLVYPVNPPVIITQPFGARPEYYRQFSVGGVPLPGHEGMDFRAYIGDQIFAVAGGIVSTVAEFGNYGYQVRIKHHRGETVYESIYAHGERHSARVNVGDSVNAGQLIMRADSTGNVQGAHLHFTLKCAGATLRGDTPYPGDIIDPTGLFLQAGDGANSEALPRRVVMAEPRLKVRKEPTATAAIVGYATHGAIVITLTEKDGWGLIADPVSGWIQLKWTQLAPTR